MVFDGPVLAGVGLAFSGAPGFVLDFVGAALPLFDEQPHTKASNAAHELVRRERAGKRPPELPLERVHSNEPSGHRVEFRQ